jgi:DNA-binding NarL/FixJ family response regulator
MTSLGLSLHSPMVAKILQARFPLQPDPVDAPGEIYVGLVMSHSLAAHHLVEVIKANNMLPVILNNRIDCADVFPAGARVVIIIDLWGPPLPVTDYLDAFTAAVPGGAFLALDEPRDQIEIAHLLRAGFAGFISHDQAIHLLGAAINAVAEGQVWATPEVLRVYMDLTSRRPGMRTNGIEVLTVRENQILDLLRHRYSNKEMANFLGISECTVKFHVSNVLTKLHVSDRRDVMDREQVQPLMAYAPSLKKSSRPATVKAVAHLTSNSTSVDSQSMPGRVDSAGGG